MRRRGASPVTKLSTMHAEKDFNGYTAAQRAAIVEQCEAIDREEAFREALNEAYGQIEVCGYKYDAAQLLESVDPVAFRCGVNDYFGNEDYVEVFHTLESGETVGGTYSKEDADEAAESVETENN